MDMSRAQDLVHTAFPNERTITGRATDPEAEVENDMQYPNRIWDEDRPDRSSDYSIWNWTDDVNVRVVMTSKSWRWVCSYQYCLTKNSKIGLSSMEKRSLKERKESFYSGCLCQRVEEFVSRLPVSQSSLPLLSFLHLSTSSYTYSSLFATKHFL